MVMNKHSEADDSLIFPDFDQIQVSTRTFIAMTNLSIDLEKLFNTLPITELKEIPAKPTRKRGGPNPFAHIAPGSILTLKYKNRIRGVELKSRKVQKKKEPRWFRNSFTVVMVLADKNINFKVYSDGLLQLTGCKLDSHPEDCVKYLWEAMKASYCEGTTEDLINPEHPGVYKFSRNEGELQALFIPAMRNVDFSMGFIVDREKLALHVNTHSPYHALLETSSGYIGVNIKIPLQKPIISMPISKLICRDDTWTQIMTTYEEYLDHLRPEERKKKLDKERFTTLLVFHSGRTILSSVTEDYSRDAYFKFVELIRESFDDIEERLV